MILTEFRTMRGPNMWSDNHHKLLVLKLNYSEYSRSVINDITAHIKNKLGAFTTFSDDEPDPLFMLTGLIAKFITFLQPNRSLLYTDRKLIGKNSYYAIASYEEEEVGVEAIHMVFDIIDAIILGKTPLPPSIAKKELRGIYNKFYPGPSTLAVIRSAQKRNIPVKKIMGGYISFGQGKYQKRIAASISETTGDIAVEIAGDKDTTKRLLEEALIPVPKGFLVRREKSLLNFSLELGFPLVIKPWNANKGKGVTSNITDLHSLHRAYTLATAFSNPVIIEQHISGSDFRFLVVGYKLIAVAKRVPACVIGNGYSSIQELIDMINADPARGEGHEKVLTKIVIDEFTEHILSSKKLTLNDVPKKDECIFLKNTANLSTGGTAEDVTDDVHPENILLAERAAKIIGLDICGIDIIAPDIKTPISLNGGAVLEVNAAPGLRMHISPSKGQSRNVGDPIIDLMFPHENKGRVPIVAVTGTNGKTTTCRLMAFISSGQGFNVGLTTTDGIYLNNTLIDEGDCTGPNSAKFILREPTIDFAVLECARGGIIRAGLGFDQCDIGIVTNIAEDHLGLKDVYTLNDLARVKRVVPASVKPDGYAILNASDDLVYGMRINLKCNVGLFSTDHENIHIKEHCESGGIAAIVDKDQNIVILKAKEKIIIENIVNIPLTMEGKAEFMVENILPVVLSSYFLGFSIEKMRNSLRLFNPSVEKTPGRLNKFKINDVNIIVDYAHNPHGLNALGKFLSHIDKHKIGIVTGVGDRRNNDIREIGRIAAEIYDEVIIRIDNDTRGRPSEEISNLITEGLHSVNKKMKHHIIPDTKDALKFAINHAEKDAYIIISAENVPQTIKIMQELEDEFNSI
jgi:cyanophycin synthetase